MDAAVVVDRTGCNRKIVADKVVLVGSVNDKMMAVGGRIITVHIQGNSGGKVGNITVSSSSNAGPNLD